MGELLDFDFNTVRDRALDPASDQRHAHRTTIEAHLFGRADTLFDIQQTPTFFDLTNTYFEGDARWPPQAQRGHDPKIVPGRIAAMPHC